MYILQGLKLFSDDFECSQSVTFYNLDQKVKLNRFKKLEYQIKKIKRLNYI